MRWFQVYLVCGFCILAWFAIATANGWKAVNLGVLDGSTGGGYGRSHGGSWGFGK